MINKNERKIIVKKKIDPAIENFKQAELEGAESLTPITYRWAKTKIYDNRKKMLNLKTDEKTQDEAAADACAAAAQLLNIVRAHAKHEESYPSPDLIEKNAIENFVNEGGLVI